ncbi:LOW QUALITY PROTEIN: endoribonuclease L-PSP [Vibrio sp. JCM 19052]|nr:LOW QUALITY PROTEIN: endoribonuclease L-PSP [Vibrio sp. JCM 19052]
MIFTSGQLPVDSATGKVVEGGITAQSHQSLTNLKHVLEAGNGSDTVLKTTCYLANISDFAEFNKVYAEFFQKDCPARSCFAVKDLPLGVLIEVEAIASKK